MRRKHDMHIDNLVEKLEQSDDYFRLEINVEYHTRAADGEIDILGYRRDGWFDYYEIKCTDHERARKRAEKQLSRAKKHFPKIARTFMYFGDTKELIPYKSN